MLASTVSVAALPAHAADDDGTRALPRAVIEVVGVAPLPGLGVDRDKLPYTVQSAGGADLRVPGGASLADTLLRRFAGLNASDLQGNPLLPEVTFHGYRASSLLGAPQGVSVFLDGVRVNEAFGDIVSWDLIPDAALERVLLITGSNPVYGLNTLGGALALTTRSGLTSPGGTVDVRAGSFGRRRVDLTYGGHDDDGRHAFVAATVQSERGWREHSPGHVANVFAKVGGTWGDTSVEATFLAARSTLTGNGLVPDGGGGGDDDVARIHDASRRAVYTWPDETRNRVVQGALRGTRRLDDATEATAQAYFRAARRDTVNGDVDETYAQYVADCAGGFTADGTPRDEACGYTAAGAAALPAAVINTTRTRQETAGVAVAWSRDAATHRLLVGGDLQRSRVRYRQFEQPGAFTAEREAIAEPGTASELFSGVHGTTTSAGAYATDTWSVTPSMHVTASLRQSVSRVSNTLEDADGGDQPGESFTYRSLNPALGFAWAANDRLTLFGGGSQSTRVPTAIELGCANPDAPCRLPAGLQSDPWLAQVTARTLELGLRARPWDGAKLTASAFRTRNRDDILFLRAPQTQQGYFANFPRTRNQGIDVVLEQALGALDLRLAYSYLDATYDASGALVAGERTLNVTPGMRIAGIPRNTVRASVDWRAGAGLTIGADVFAVSRVATSGNEDGLVADAAGDAPAVSGDASIAGYALLGLRASWRPAPGLELSAGVANALGRRYASYGALADDLFPGGRIVAPHVEPGDASVARFVAPGAPTSVYVGLRYAM